MENTENKQVDAVVEDKQRVFRLTIMFDRKEGSPFGGVSAQSLSLIIHEGVKNQLLEQFHKQEGVISVQLSTGAVRHVNARNILYIDEEEIVEGDKK